MNEDQLKEIWPTLKTNISFEEFKKLHIDKENVKCDYNSLKDDSVNNVYRES